MRQMKADAKQESADGAAPAAVVNQTFAEAGVRQPIPDPLRDQPDFAVSSALEAEIDELITHYPKKRSASLMLLHEMQERFGYIPRQAIEWIAAKLELQPINIYEL